MEQWSRRSSCRRRTRRSRRRSSTSHRTIKRGIVLVKAQNNKSLIACRYITGRSSGQALPTTPMHLQIAALCSLHLPASLESRTQHKSGSPCSASANTKQTQWPKPPFAPLAACQALLLQREPWQASEFLTREFQPA